MKTARILLAKARHATFEQIAVVPPLGILYLASVLRARGHEVAVFDMRPGETDARRFVAALQAFRPEVVGLSAITFEARMLTALASAARAALPGVPIVAGGPHATAYPERCLASGVDYAVIGEGEETLIELICALQGQEDPSAVAGVVSRDATGTIKRAPARTPIDDLDTLPFPAWDLLDIKAYAGYKGMAPIGHRRYMPISTSRGCPYRCVYCHQVHGKRYRARSAENVLAELRQLHERYGIDEVEVYDDTFNLNRERTLAILEGIERLPWRVTLSFPNGLRTDLLDRELIRALRRAGTSYMAVAVESAMPRVQTLIGKRLDVERVRQNIGIAVDEGLFVTGFFMLGFPTETLEEARQTVQFAIDSRLHLALFFTVVPYAGTELYERWHDLLVARGLPEDTQDVCYYYTQHNLSEMTNDELFGLQRSAWRRFFLDPRRVARIALRHPRRWSLAREGILTLRKMLPRRTRP